MNGINKVILIGNVGADPEVRQFNDGGMVANVSIATTERWTDKQTSERKEATEWHRVVFRNRLAEIVQQYLRKGSQVYVEGKLKTRKYQDNNGQDRYVTEVVAMNMQMLSGNQTSNQQQAPAPQGFNNNMPHPNQPSYADVKNGRVPIPQQDYAVSSSVVADNIPF